MIDFRTHIATYPILVLINITMDLALLHIMLIRVLLILRKAIHLQDNMKLM